MCRSQSFVRLRLVIKARRLWAEITTKGLTWDRVIALFSLVLAWFGEPLPTVPQPESSSGEPQNATDVPCSKRNKCPSSKTPVLTLLSRMHARRRLLRESLSIQPSSSTTETPKSNASSETPPQRKFLLPFLRKRNRLLNTESGTSADG